MRVTCMQIKQRFLNLRQKITNAGINFVEEAYLKILQKINRVKFP